MKSFEELTTEEQEYWNNKVKNLSDIEKLWIRSKQDNKCFMCKKRFENGTVNDLDKIQSKGFYTGEFLFHLKSTHGIPFSIPQEWLKEIAND